MDADADRPAALPQVLPASRGPVTVRSGGAAAADAETVVLAAYEAYARDLNAFARSLVREREAAEDIVAEAYLRLVREAQAGRTPDDVRGWLYRVTANLVLSRGRRIAVARRFVAHLVDRRTGESPEARHLRLDIEPGLRDALLALPADSRIAVVMAARGASGREIAEVLGRSEAATRTLLTRARQRLRERLNASRRRRGRRAAMTVPIAHARALDLAGLAPAFAAGPDDAVELHAHLRTCPECRLQVARMRADLAAIGAANPAVSPRLHDRIREAAVSRPRSGVGAIGVLAILALLAVGVVGASIGVGAYLNRPQDPLPPEGPRVAVSADDAVSWRTDVVAMAAREFAIQADGLSFSGVPGVDVQSDPGDLDRWTLEARWAEHGREQRMNLYFKGDVASWWIDGIQVYDGTATGAGKQDWVAFAGGPWAKTPRGSAFEGDINVRANERHGTRRRSPGRRPDRRPAPGQRHRADRRWHHAPGARPTTRATRPGRAARCTAREILALPPQQAEMRLLAMGYKLSWRWEYVTSRFEGGATGYAEALARAPQTGYISDAAVGSDGELIVFVEDPARPMNRAPWPARPEGCPAPQP